MAESLPRVDKVPREQFYKEMNWDGKEMFNAVAGMVYDQDPKVTELMKVARKADQALFLSQIALSTRQQLVSKHDLATFDGAVALLSEQWRCMENAVMAEKQRQAIKEREQPHMVVTADGGHQQQQRQSEDGSCVVC